jgi:hypothetical protein
MQNILIVLMMIEFSTHFCSNYSEKAAEMELNEAVII